MSTVRSLPGNHRKGTVDGVNAVLAQLVADLEALRSDVIASSRVGDHLTDPAHVAGACNLDHYLALRSSDLRPLQTVLSSFGLSSLGRSESRVLATVDAVLRAARALATVPESDRADDDVGPPGGAGADDGVGLLERNTEALLGSAPKSRRTRIMVTMPSEAATNPAFTLALVEHGMDVARINCAHDDKEAWRAIADHVRTAASQMAGSSRFHVARGRCRPCARSPCVLRRRKVRR